MPGADLGAAKTEEGSVSAAPAPQPGTGRTVLDYTCGKPKAGLKKQLCLPKM